MAKPIPTRPGNYEKDGWRYIYLIERAGSQSERRIGHLLRRGVRIKGKVGEAIDTPFGQFRYFGKDDPENMSYNIGWLNTITMDQPVSEEKDVSMPAAGNTGDS